MQNSIFNTSTENVVLVTTMESTRMEAWKKGQKQHFGLKTS